LPTARAGPHADIAALADQPALHGPVASPTTAWRVLVNPTVRTTTP
jgi:hypothetical protein